MFISEFAARINRKPDPVSAWPDLCLRSEGAFSHCFPMLSSSGRECSLLDLCEMSLLGRRKGTGGQRQ